ncbi:hypothetical protein CL622_02985 [archaeon]|nr:hypothetical protein [archaeon]
MPAVSSAVRALIVDNDTFLVIKKEINGKELWDLPGGRIEYGESIADAVKREVKEEVSLDVTVDKPLGSWWFFRLDNRDQMTCATYVCIPSHTNVDLNNNPHDENIVDFKWLSKDEFLSDQYTADHESLKQLIKERL